MVESTCSTTAGPAFCAATVPVSTHEDPELFRPIDVPVLVGDSGKLAALCGWKPELEIDETLSAVLEEWRRRQL